MGSFADDLAADLADAIGDYEQTFVWNGETLPCVRTTDPAALMQGPGGTEEDISDRITVPLSALDPDDLPTQGDLIDGYALQILRTDPNVGHLVLWCGPPMNMNERPHDG